VRGVAAAVANHPQPTQEWVVDRQMVRWAVAWFVFGLAYFAWFLVVVIGEVQGWTSDPGAWALLPTDVWAFLGLAIYAILIVFLLALMVRREQPARVYRVGDDGRVQD
jgi:uncharacterized membrane protein